MGISDHDTTCMRVGGVRCALVCECECECKLIQRNPTTGTGEDFRQEPWEQACLTQCIYESVLERRLPHEIVNLLLMLTITC